MDVSFPFGLLGSPASLPNALEGHPYLGAGPAVPADFDGSPRFFVAWHDVLWYIYIWYTSIIYGYMAYDIWIYMDIHIHIYMSYMDIYRERESEREICILYIYGMWYIDMICIQICKLHIMKNWQSADISVDDWIIQLKIAPNSINLQPKTNFTHFLWDPQAINHPLAQRDGLLWIPGSSDWKRWISGLVRSKIWNIYSLSPWFVDYGLGESSESYNILVRL